MSSISIRLGAMVFAALLSGCLHVPPAPLSPADGAHALEARTLADPRLRSFLAERFGRPRDPWPRTSWNVEELTLAAIYFHPSLRVARAQLERADAHEEKAAQRPNPSLTLNPQRIDPARGYSPWSAFVQLNWTIETAGKRAHYEAVARAGTHGAAANLESAVWLLRGQLTQAVFTLRAAMLRSVDRERSLALLTQRLALFERRSQAGAGTLSEVARERSAQTRASVERANSARLEAEARARLAAAIGLPRQALADLALALEPDGAWTLAADLGSMEARDTALQGRSDVLAALADYDAAEANLRLELALQYPNLVLGPTDQYQQGTHQWGLALTLDLPLLNQNQGGVAEARAARDESAARFEALQAQVMAEVDDACASLDAAQDERLRARESLAAAEDGATFAARALAAGATDRAAWLAAESVAVQARLLEVDAEEQVQHARGRLESAIRPHASELVAVASRGRSEVQKVADGN